MTVGENINWFQDFKTSYVWPQKYFLEYSEKELINGRNNDIKIPWELSRMHHFVLLGQGWWITKNDRYLDEIFKQWESWKDQNPFCYGINWTSTMEVAIRAVNIICTMHLIEESTILKKYKNNLVNSILEHGTFIEHNLELGYIGKNISAGNHFLANMSGLAIIGMTLGNESKSKNWSKYGINGLEYCMKLMVLEGGLFFESSTSYHRFATELFLYPLIIGEKYGYQFSESYKKKISKMLNVINQISTPDGSVPQVGDGDDGRFIILSDYPNWKRHDYTYLLHIGSVFFNKKFKNLKFKFCNELFWLFPDYLTKNNNFKDDVSLNENVKTKEYGITVIKNNNLKDYILIRSGAPSSDHPNAHCHNDQLSFELWLNNLPIVIDSGTGTYTSNINVRNKFRSTSMHNTIMINNNEINYISSKSFFGFKSDSFCKVVNNYENDDYVLLTCERINKKTKNPVIHKRTFKYYKLGMLSIKDELIASDKFFASSFLNFHPSLNPKLQSIKGEYIITNLDNFVIQIIDESNCIRNIEIIPNEYSQSYGNIINSKKLKIDIISDSSSSINISFKRL